ncbi:fibrobacter succinogenes major paralogous domain-containing protein [Flagellimonas abyssi]|uniref:Fibrobacter succinogenes major paralogous domain-containing protein n=1 Tax=Flagellimonas abyssi TaxID=2864871 RepID=A0ABS7EYX2_9FLAO|nr:fibrobacter succinogenes major paralogous domain-containing protein [Allomuricauda abyssi]MBW8202023.1 fibrobacter succinogenes major paralogous domain-containing protein [Allomuricauda abyssi]
MRKYLNFRTLFILSILFAGISCSSSDDSNNGNGEPEPENYAPTLTTNPIEDITYLSSKSGGEISDNGGFPIIAKGIVWSTTENPTIDLVTKTNDGSGSNDFSSVMSELEQNTEYYVRAYARNNQSTGIGYGNQITFRTVDTLIVNGTDFNDIDGNSYSTLVINGEEWSAKNLNVSRYRNGDVIPQVQDATEWENLTSGAWCYYGNDSNNEPSGKLYNWYAVNDSRGLAPQGWHIPSDSEWENLEKYLISAGYNYDRSASDDKLGKAIASTSFQQGTASAGTGSPALVPSLNNRTGFNALPGGLRGSVGEFQWIDKYSCWWSSTESGSVSAKFRDITGHLTFGLRGTGAAQKTSGMSIRLIKD